jgi:Fructose-2,6-bisphosphatase
MCNIYFVRHGMSKWTKTEIVKGFKDLSLNKIGKEQAFKTALRLKGLPKDTILLTSALKRSFETAKIIGEVIKIEIKETIEDLNEQFLSTNFLETDENFKSRISSCLDKILEKYKDECKDIIIVSHQRVFSILTKYLLDKETRKLDFCEVVRINLKEKKMEFM